MADSNRVTGQRVPSDLKLNHLVEARRVTFDLNNFLLLQSGFRWVQDFLFNR